MRLFGSAGGTLGGFEELLSKAGTGQELEGPLSPVGDWMYSQRADGTGIVTAGAYARALDQAAALKEATAESGSELADAPWTFMGPINIGGRVSEIALDPTPADIVYAATASGGVWKSTDGAVTWTYSWDPNLTQAMGAIAVASDGTIYAGTGEVNPGGGSVVWGGTGLYRSEDGGATWQPIGLPTSGAIGRIAVDPSDPKRVFVASAGNLFVPGGERGLYRTTDGGDTWERVLAGDNDTTGAADVAVDPANPQNILVGMWDHQRLPTHRLYSGPGSGVYLSKDGGATWQRATLPGNVAPEEVGRIGVAFAPSTPTRAYAVVANKANGSGVGLWRSDDGGATWTKTSATPAALSQSSYGWWFGKVWV
ncbi:MAG: VPS10 domain-containing protein, partial [Nocardioidaceae bacterium]